MKTKIQYVVRVYALSLAVTLSLMVGLSTNTTVRRSQIVRVDAYSQSHIFLAGDDGQESHGGKGGGGGKSHG